MLHKMNISLHFKIASALCSFLDAALKLSHHVLNLFYTIIFKIILGGLLFPTHFSTPLVNFLVVVRQDKTRW